MKKPPSSACVIFGERLAKGSVCVPNLGPLKTNRFLEVSHRIPCEARHWQEHLTDDTHLEEDQRGLRTCLESRNNNMPLRLLDERHSEEDTTIPQNKSRGKCRYKSVDKVVRM